MKCFKLVPEDLFNHELAFLPTKNEGIVYFYNLNKKLN